MRKAIILLFFLFMLNAAAFCADSVSTELKPLTLEECFKLSLKQSEIIAIDKEKIKEAEAHFMQSFGTALPQVSFVWSQTRQNSDASPSYNRSHESKFVFTQTLFSGFKEFAGMSGSRLESKERKSEKFRAEQLLFVDVSDAFYLLMELQEDLNALLVTRSSLDERIKELKQREGIGRSRQSEEVSTEVQLYNLEADIELVKSQKEIAKSLLEFLTGSPIDKITDDFKEEPLKSDLDYTLKADLRPDVKAAKFAWAVAEKQLGISRSGLFPTVTWESDYYLHRFSAPSDSRWYHSLQVNVPIFEGTTTYGFIKQSSAQAKESKLNFMLTRRLALQDIRDSYTNLKAYLERKAMLNKALRAAELNYSLQEKDYKSNLVNNLDVLTALQSLEDTRRNFVHTLYESRRMYWRLKVATGDIIVGE